MSQLSPDLWGQERVRFTGRGLEPSGAAVLTTSYALNGNETIQPGVITSAKEAYRGNSVVFGAILARLSLFSEARFAFRSLSDKSLWGSNETDARRNTVLRKLEKPWQDGTTGELLVRMIQDVDLAGNAYIWDAGYRLVRLRPDWVTIISELVTDDYGRQFREVRGYYYEPPQSELGNHGPAAVFTVDEVAHWSPLPDPDAMFRGMSWLTPVLREVMADDGMTQYKIKYLDNAASPNLLIRYDQKIGKTQVNNLRDRLDDRHGGVNNAFKTLILDEGADATVIGNTFEQMNFSTVQAAGENRIIIASGVPGIVIGSKEGLMAATYSNYEQAMRRFADITMRPLWRSACASLSKLVTVPAGHELWFDVTDIAALRQGEKERAETTFILAQAAAQLTGAGYTPDSVVQALESGEMHLLKAKPPEPAPAPQNPPTQPTALNGNPVPAPK